MCSDPIAHGPNDKGEFHTLKDHLDGTARKAASFAKPFGGESEARAAGLLHDLGKFRQEFQQYIRGERKADAETHHAIYGAAYALTREWLPAALAIHGHHTGLHDRHESVSIVDDPRYHVTTRLDGLGRLLRDSIGIVPTEVQRAGFVEKDVLSAEVYIRMLFSCLVDADRLDTEEHSSGKPRDIICLASVIDILLERLLKERDSKPTEGLVNAIRREISDQCLKAATKSQGFFSLTAPTGGGKTLSGMAFALTHARKWNLSRVIVVIPYLSIIEQNASEYRRVLDPDSEGLVVEHHSAVRTADSEGECGPSPADLAAENWDAPIIVTTSVQFIESLFASSPSRCRKVHNIARSVVIFDEVQTLPTHLLNPLLSILKELKENYGASFLFMTATRPSFHRDAMSLSEGFEPNEVIEIASNVEKVFTVLRRVQYERGGVLSWKEVAERLADSPQAMCVVNVRKHAYELWQRTRDAVADGEKDSIFHLSSAMCAEHRSDALGHQINPREGTVRHRLRNGLPCRLIATQVVEAGVDIDFPFVMRAMGPLDSIVQAAGRCNREGRLTGLGRVVIFTPESHSLPPGVYSTATGIAASQLDGLDLDVLGVDADLFSRYFSQLFGLTSTDYSGKGKSTIQEDRREWRFREVSKNGRVIRDAGDPVVVPYKDAVEYVQQIRVRKGREAIASFGSRDLRRLQRYMVNVHADELGRLVAVRMLEPLLPNIELYVLREGCYHDALGLLIEKRPLEDLIL